MGKSKGAHSEALELRGRFVERIVNKMTGLRRELARDFSSLKESIKDGAVPELVTKAKEEAKPKCQPAHDSAEQIRDEIKDSVNDGTIPELATKAKEEAKCQPAINNAEQTTERMLKVLVEALRNGNLRPDLKDKYGGDQDVLADDKALASTASSRAKCKTDVVSAFHATVAEEAACEN